MQEYIDKVLRLSVRLEQLSKGADKDLSKVLKKLRKEVIAIVASNKIDSKKIKEQVKKEVKKLSQKRYEEIKKVLGDNSEVAAKAALVVEESSYASLGFIADTFVSSLNTSKIVKNSLSRVMPGLRGRQITVNEMVDRFLTIGQKDLQNIVERSFIEGLSVGEISALVTDSTNAQITASRSVARTAIQSTANQARDDISKEMGADKELWLATLDSNTCEYCQGFDGKCKPSGKLPRPVAHPNCRCVLLYIPSGITCNEMKADLERVERGEDGKSRNTGKYKSYGEWIKTQSKEFQEDALGVERSKLLRTGKIKFDKMYTKSGRRKTVKQLEEHYLN